MAKWKAIPENPSKGGNESNSHPQMIFVYVHCDQAVYFIEQSCVTSISGVGASSCYKRNSCYLQNHKVQMPPGPYGIWKFTVAICSLASNCADLMQFDQYFCPTIGQKDDRPLNCCCRPAMYDSKVGQQIYVYFGYELISFQSLCARLLAEIFQLLCARLLAGIFSIAMCPAMSRNIFNCYVPGYEPKSLQSLCARL
ncbi:hypothetical protein DAPPUDRAFT_112250 [Daphnia pulex]|uniref:Uncharacterized protein n=1 Tax=Daphnia pulex TaxID=6669 RepID=E9HBE0_DAPPU|nr:hypothetical protein DAPPUDRAFT_112250 [Daphnia pulex]|eukprot:EFX70948.1 hypothetical protein DAPPUDRAFT_112250 [Daphnia pulex]